MTTRIGIVGTGSSDVRNSSALLDDYLESIEGDATIAYFILEGTKSTDSIFRLLQKDMRDGNGFELYVPKFYADIDWMQEACQSATHIGTGELVPFEINRCDSVLFFNDEEDGDLQGLLAEITVPVYDITNGNFRLNRGERVPPKRVEVVEPSSEEAPEPEPTLKDLERAVISLVEAATKVLEAIETR